METESRLVVAKVLGKGEMGSDSWAQVSFWGHETVLELAGGESGATW